MREKCPFCDFDVLWSNLVDQTDNFWLVCDQQPVAEGHLLIVPKKHWPCFGDVPPGLDGEFLALKEDVHHFLKEQHSTPVFFEHGKIGQTVAHAHLHALPTLRTILPVLRGQPGFVEINGLAALRRYYRAYGRYLYYDEGGQAYVMAPTSVRPGELHLLFAEVLGLSAKERADKARAARMNGWVIEAWAATHETGKTRAPGRRGEELGREGMGKGC